MKARVLPHTPWAAPSPWALRPLSLTVLTLALVLFGAGEALLVLAALGSTPWTVLAQGIALQTGWGVGWTTFVCSVVVMLLWWPLRLRPGLGTLLNMVLIAATLGVLLQVLAAPQTWAWRVLLCLGGIVMIGVASSLYLTCHLGAGPRDGLMVGLCQKTGWRVGVVRTMLEVSVCTIGWLLGGTLGLGTVLFAIGVGWVLQAALAVISHTCAHSST